MIENPKVGQRVWHSRSHEVGTVLEVDADGWPVVRFDGDTHEWPISPGILHSRASAASALRAEAQRLIEAADKLESEASGDPLQ